jgi:DNA polymerase
MATIGLNRENNIYITNIIPWRPPGNRQPSSEETQMCLPFVKKHIELIRPKILVFVGGTSAKALLKTHEGITKIRGKFVEYLSEDGTRIPSFSLYHPAYLLRSPGQKRVVWHDMIQLKLKLIEEGLLP